MRMIESVPERQLLRVYVDESGDRGFSARSSPVFILAAIVVRDEDEPQLRLIRDQLCTDLEKPHATVLHWAQNIQKHSQRNYVAKTIGGAPLTLLYVIVDKASLRAASGLHNHERLYNYAVRRLIERLSWYIRDEEAEAIVTFARIRNFKYTSLETYIAYLSSSPNSIHWKSFKDLPRIDDPKRKVLLQMADIAAGCLSNAIVPDQWGGFEYSHLREIQPLIYRNTPGKITSYGLHVISGKPSTILSDTTWWANFPNK